MRLFGLGVALFIGLGGCTALDSDYCADDGACLLMSGANDGKTICHPSRHVCIAAGSCLVDEDCLSADASRCDVATNHCQPCLFANASDQSCQHLDGKLCGQLTAGGSACVECLANLDCPASAPICDRQRCRSCQQHNDCVGMLNCDDGTQCSDSLVCILEGDLDASLSGRCAKNGNGSTGRVAYVHNDPLSCSNSGTGSDVDHPFCNLDIAYANLAPRTFVRVLAGADVYELPSSSPISAGQVIFIGASVPSRGISQPATIDFERAQLSVLGQASVTFDGFDLFQSGENTTLISCRGDGRGVPNLVLRNNLVRGSTGFSSLSSVAAIDLLDCQAKVQRNFIGALSLTELNDPNHVAHSRALRIQNTGLAGTSFRVENNVIAGNWDYAVDLDGVQSPAGVIFRFNTVVGRATTPQSAGAIRCPGGPMITVTIADSIIWHNASGAQFLSPARCKFQQVVVGSSDIATGLINKDPQLGESFELLSNSQNSDCCVDQAQPTDSEPRFDIKGLPRPQGKSWDLGAYELPIGM